MLKRFVELEATNNLVDCTTIDGTPTKAMTFAVGDGAAKATAAKLARDGYGVLVWNAWTRNRLFIISDKGRHAVT